MPQITWYIPSYFKTCLPSSKIETTCNRKPSHPTAEKPPAPPKTMMTGLIQYLPLREYSMCWTPLVLDLSHMMAGLLFWRRGPLHAHSGNYIPVHGSLPLGPFVMFSEVSVCSSCVLAYGFSYVCFLAI